MTAVLHALGVRLLRGLMSWLGRQSSSSLRSFIVLASRAHLWLFRVSRRRLGRRLGLREASIAMLTTVGRRTGRPRTVPLLALRDGQDYVVVGSHGGLDEPPAWVLNLRAFDHAELDADGGRVAVRAIPVDGPDHDRLWGRFVTAYAGYADYRARTHREFSIFLLRPQT